MSKVGKIIERVDAVKPNDFPQEQKIAWIAEVDGEIGLKIHLLPIETVQAKDYTADTELSVGFPHESVYDLYLGAMIDFHNGEYRKYQNSMEAYNAKLSAYSIWYAMTYDPAQMG